MTTTFTAQQAAKFDHLLHLDMAVRISWVQITYGQDKYASLNADKARFFAALDALTPDEVVAFREYRAAIKNAEV